AARLYVTYIGDRGYELAVIDPATSTVLYKAKTPQIIRWIFPSRPGMAISPDGRWLYLLKTNYSVGSSEYALLTFDTRESRFLPEEQAIPNCPRPQLLSVQGEAKLHVLCDGADSEFFDGLRLNVQHLQNYALTGDVLYTASSSGRIQAVDL